MTPENAIAIAGVVATLFLAGVGAAWTLLHSLVFKPLRALHEELALTNRNLMGLTIDLTATKNDHGARIVGLEKRADQIEVDVRRAHFRLDDLR